LLVLDVAREPDSPEHSEGMLKSLETLETELKSLIVEDMDLEDMEPEEIETEAPLFGDGLGLDSIDALELGFAISKEYGVKLGRDAEANAKHFQSVKTLAVMLADLLNTKTEQDDQS
jgi:acyl carrier protein